MFGRTDASLERGFANIKGFYNWTPEFLQKKQDERIQLLMDFLEEDKNNKSIERNI